ncbi:HAMP domain-containing sensor histidine kinase [Aestuariivirga sp.]|uniref:sensor histidine kinase n=1 Tax=Aestuariivirga sp. TaxID=2650926 RepID=UPI0025C602B9|nr:HAMP domain-containing sensor histidine kinase [Aestuariivirga sp.]MCA3556596.1 HAMP domain-containing histidine kinase [Aestuariivirga sp.]
MRLPTGIDPEKLPVLAALAAAGGFTLLLAGAIVIYATVDALGILLIAAFMAAALGLAASGWYVHWRALASPAAAHAGVERRSPLRNAGQDSPVHRLLEAVAVEVKTSATTLAGFAELLPAATADEARRHLLDGSLNLLGFATQLHDYIRFERGRLRLKQQQVDAGELVEAALVCCRASAEEAGTTIAAAIPAGIEVSCDAERIRQALASLIMWSARGSTAGGIVDVKLLRLPDRGLAIDIISRAEATSGVQPRDRLFEPQLALAGLKGFALPIARRVALLHAGEVTVASSPGEGARARLTLPAARVAWPDEHRPARAA